MREMSVFRTLLFKHRLKCFKTYSHRHASNKNTASNNNWTNGNIKMNLQVIGTGARGTGASLILSTNTHNLQSMLFNCGEGIFRNASDRDIKLLKVRNVFLTSNSWNHISGLISLCNFFKIITEEKIKIHGPPGIKNILNQYIWFAQPNLEIIEYTNPNNVFSVNDNHTFIRMIPIYPKETNYISEIKLNNQSCRDSVSLVYIMNIPKTEGYFKLEKCVKLNVPPGPSLLQLKRGHEITLDDGTVIKPSDVRQNSDSSRTVFVVDILSTSYLESAIENPELQNITPDVIFHFTRGDVASCNSYQLWMSTFSSSTQHIFVNDRNTCFGIEAAHKLQCQLNLVAEDVFPLLDNDALVPSHYKNNAEEQNNFSNVVNAMPGLTYNIRPQFTLDETNIPSLDVEDCIKSCYNIIQFADVQRECKEQYHKEKIEMEEYPHVVFLGTNSSTPSPTRNTSCILLNISETQSIILDCGEGSYAQLLGHYGFERCQKILTNLSAIYISHKHLDHHMGLYGIIIGRREAFLRAGVDIPQIPVMYPPNITKLLHLREDLCESISNDILPISNMEFLYLSRKEKSAKHVDLLKKLGMDKIETTFVEHCKYSYGIALTHSDKWKIVYSGDTMFSNHLIYIGKNCDLLIHEATFDDHLKDDAKLKRHSTNSEALKVASMMQAKAVVLTHFSVRYSRIPMLEEENLQGVGVAFDNMKINFENAKRLHHLYPVLKTLFGEEYENNRIHIFKKLRERALKNDKENTDPVDISSRIYKQVYK